VISSHCGLRIHDARYARDGKDVGLVETSFRQQKPTKGNNSYPLIKNNMTAIKLNLLPKCRQAADFCAYMCHCVLFAFSFLILCVCVCVCVRELRPTEKGGESRTNDVRKWQTAKVYAAIFVWQFSISISIPWRRFICIWCEKCVRDLRP